PRLAESALLRPELRALAERAAVGLLAHERDPPRLELVRDPLESRGRAGEIGLPQIARAGRRAAGCIRDADSVVEELELLRRLEQARRQSCRVQEPPEVVARIREVRACSR